jgi:flagellar basal body-associated protein FliL
MPLWLIIVLVVLIITAITVALLMMPMMGTAQAPGNSLQVPTIDDGTPVPVLFGIRWMGTQLAWFGDVQVVNVSVNYSGK